MPRPPAGLGAPTSAPASAAHVALEPVPGRPEAVLEEAVAAEVAAAAAAAVGRSLGDGGRASGPVDNRTRRLHLETTLLTEPRQLPSDDYDQDDTPPVGGVRGRE